MERRADAAGALGLSYVRFESPTPNSRGVHVGIFGLANGLARSDRLSPQDWRWWRTANNRLDAAYPDPAKVDPSLFDRRVHPLVSCWFAEAASDLLAQVAGYLDLLDRYGVAWIRRVSSDPGRILYADDVQVVVAPWADGAS